MSRKKFSVWVEMSFCADGQPDGTILVINKNDLGIDKDTLDGGAFVQRANPDADTLLFEFEPTKKGTSDGNSGGA